MKRNLGLAAALCVGLLSMASSAEAGVERLYILNSGEGVPVDNFSKEQTLAAMGAPVRRFHRG